MIADNNFWKNKKILITGHTGFKGSWLSLILTAFKAKITGYSLQPEKRSFFKEIKLQKEINSITGNLNNKNKLYNTLKKCKPEIIFHLAAQPLVLDSYRDPIGTFETNVIGTINLLECIKKVKSVKTLIIVTTDKCYENKGTKNKFKENNTLGGKDPYSLSKVFVENLATFYKKELEKNDVNVATVRAGNVLGPGDYAKNRLIPDILRNIQDNKKIIIRNPEHVRPWQDILDVLNGYLLLAEKLHQNYKYSGPWNFGPQKIKNKNVLKITRLVLKEFNFKKGYKIEKSKNKQEEFFLFLDSQKSRKELNWHTKIKTQTSVNNIYKWSKHSKNYKLRKYFSDNLIKNYFNIKF